jgi:hypothetical protein
MVAHCVEMHTVLKSTSLKLPGFNRIMAFFSWNYGPGDAAVSQVARGARRVKSSAGETSFWIHGQDQKHCGPTKVNSRRGQ